MESVPSNRLSGRVKRSAALVAVLLLSCVLAQECCAGLDIAYDNNVAATGIQDWGQGLGLVFTVNSPLTINYLGAFDNGANANLAGQDGVHGVTVQIYSVTNPGGGGPVGAAYGPSVTFTTSSNSLPGFQQIHGDAFLPIAPTTLVAGTYEVVAYNDNNANSGTGGWGGRTLSTFGGAVSYSNSIGLANAYFAYSQIFPTNPDGHTYAAGTFATTPEPSSLAVWGAGAVSMFFVARRRRKS